MPCVLLLLQVEETADVTLGGVVLPEAAKERPLSGVVVRTGPGKYDKDRWGWQGEGETWWWWAGVMCSGVWYGSSVHRGACTCGSLVTAAAALTATRIC
jgi:hypothetical protein